MLLALNHQCSREELRAIIYANNSMHHMNVSVRPTQDIYNPAGNALDLLRQAPFLKAGIHAFGVHCIYNVNFFSIPGQVIP